MLCKEGLFHYIVHSARGEGGLFGFRWKIAQVSEESSQSTVFRTDLLDLFPATFGQGSLQSLQNQNAR